MGFELYLKREVGSSLCDSGYLKRLGDAYPRESLGVALRSLLFVAYTDKVKSVLADAFFSE